MNTRVLRVAAVAFAAVSFMACGKADETAKVVDSAANATPSVAQPIDSVPLTDSMKTADSAKAAAVAPVVDSAAPVKK